MRKLAVVVLALFVAVVALTGCSKGTGKAQNSLGVNAAETLTVKVLDIGQGDAILIKAANQVILVDTGDVPTREKLVSYIKKEGITTIDKVIITHPHADHLGGMAAIIDNFKVLQIYDSGQTTNSSLYKQYLAAVQKKNIPFTVMTAGSEIEITKDIKLKLLAPEQPFITEDALNNNSIVAKLIYNDFSMLLTGDAEKASEERMLAKYGKELKSNILKAGHHGSNTSSSPAFLSAVAPEAAIISVGQNNDYHHPHPSTIKKYGEMKLKVYRTDLNGVITITSDGKTYNIDKEK